MKRVLTAINIVLVLVVICHAQSGTGIELEKKIVIQDMVGRTLEYTWQTGPFKDAAHVLVFIDPNTFTFSMQSGKNMTDPSKVKFETMQVSDQVIILSWRSKEYAQTVVLTLNFETHMIYQVVVTGTTNYLSQGSFVLKK